MIIATAPHRITFGGGGTDFPEYYNEKEAYIIGCAIDRYATVVIAKPESSVESKFRISYSKTEKVDSIDDIEHPIIRAALRELKLDIPLHITSVADVPASTGLGTSSAFTVALLAGLCRLNGERFTKEGLAQQAIHIERNVAGLSGGHQDQWWSAIGGFRTLKFSASGFSYKTIKDEHLVKFIEENAYLIPLNETRSSSAESGRLIQKIKAKDLSDLDSIRENAMSLDKNLRSRNRSLTSKLEHLSDTLKATWKSKKNHTNISAKLQELDDVSIEHGIPLKLCGGGYTGFVTVIASIEQVKILKNKNFTLIPIKTDKKGVRIIHG